MRGLENETIVLRDVAEEIKESYLRYSMSVIIARALPDVRDGLKPSQRRILYAMRQLDLTPGAKHRKCAKICGDTSGDYHPHGETVIYPTLVRMAQGWSMRYPLIGSQGNFGSIDGDPPAAMRYTEARLTHASMALMEDLAKDTVDLVLNYDETRHEPVVFPAKFPQLLTNGSSGIAVGMATNIPPHNLAELTKAILLLLADPHAAIEALLEVLPGPDFPTGGVICGLQGVHDAYRSGRGKLLLRAAIDIEEQQGERQQLVVEELPFNVSKADVIRQIADLVNNKALTGISDIRDESDKEGMRIVIELKQSEVPEVIINQLFKLSQLQVTFGCNMLVLDKGVPQIMNIKQLIRAWIEHRMVTICRRIRFQLHKAEARIHLVVGYLTALDHLEAIVRLIRAAKRREEVKQQLIAHYAFTPRQADAVLDLRLYQLTGLERQKLAEEHHSLEQQIAHYREILASEALVEGIIREELLEVSKQHPSERRTKIIAAQAEPQMEDLIADTQVVITISNDDYVKRMPEHFFREQKRGGQGVIGFDIKKESDNLKDLYVASTHDTLLIFTSLGRCYWLKVWQIPEAKRRSKGRPLVNFLEDLAQEEHIAAVLKVRGFAEEGQILFVTQRGVIKKTALQAFSFPRRKGVIAIKIDEADCLIAARLMRGEQQVMLFNRYGMAVRFDHRCVRSMGRTARGVRGIQVRKSNDAVVCCEVVDDPQESVLIVCENGYGKRSKVEEFRQTQRGGSGVRSILISKRNGPVIGALAVAKSDSILLMSSMGQALRISMRDVRVIGRSTQGVRLVNLKADDRLVAIRKLEQGE